MKKLLKQVFPEESAVRWILFGFYSHPISFFPALIRSLLATNKLVGHFFPIRIRIGAGQRLEVRRAPGARVCIKGNIAVYSQLGNKSPSSINCGKGSMFVVAGDFDIGPGVHIEIGNGAKLKLGGRKNTGSGITCNSRISVEKQIEIGTDSIMAWDVFISDSDWHNIKNTTRSVPVFIGDNVWISHGVSILKGVQIPSGCIVGAKSLVIRGGFPGNSLIAGSPAVVRRTDIEWSW